MLYRKEANSRDRISNTEKGRGGSIVETRKEIHLKYSNMAKYLNTFVAHCLLLFFFRIEITGAPLVWLLNLFEVRVLKISLQSVGSV